MNNQDQSNLDLTKLLQQDNKRLTIDLKNQNEGDYQKIIRHLPIIFIRFA